MEVFVLVKTEGHMDESRNCYDTQDFVAAASSEEKARELLNKHMDQYMEDYYGSPPTEEDTKEYKEGFKEEYEGEKGKHEILKVELDEV